MLKRSFPALLLIVGLAACGCGSDNSSSPTFALPDYAQTLQPRLERLRREMLAPGAVVLIRSASLGNWAQAFGHRALDGREAVRTDDHFRIGSNTKTMTGTVILQLVDEGRLSLEDPISRYLAGVPNGDRITIDHLLSMRSGLFNYSTTLEFNQQLDDQPQKVWRPQELLAIAFPRSPVFEPGAQYNYSNTNTVLLGLVIEQLTGQSVEQAFQERLFSPAGLTRTELPPGSFPYLPLPAARGYMFSTNAATVSSEVLPEDQQIAAQAGMLLPRDVTEASPSWAWTAGAGISTAPELASYAQRLVGGGYLSADLQRRRLNSLRSVDPSNPAAAGYGWNLAKLGPCYGHTGELPGFNSFMGHDPEHQLTLIVWTNLNAAPDGRPPAVTMARTILAELYPAAP